MEVSAQELLDLRVGLVERLPASLEVLGCLERRTPEGKDSEVVLGCRAFIAAKDFDAWMASMPDFKPYPVYGVPAEFGLFSVGAPFPVTTYFGNYPPDDGRFRGAIVFANAERTIVLIYLRSLLIID